MAEPELIEDFFGVYLLICLNPRYKGRTYIGYTRDPKRRITQHNRGSAAGGAHRTSNRGPWKMVLIVHGFPNNISALRFEWAWQNPTKTTRLQHLYLRKIPRKETVYKFKLRVLSEMLRVGPWCRLPLIIRWLETEYFEEFPVDRKPPEHMTITFGPVKSRNLKKKTPDPTPNFAECLLCSKYITSTQIKLACLNSNCKLECHITCLGDTFLSPGEYVPVEGTCPICKTKLKWGDLIRKIKGCKIDDIKDTRNDKNMDSDKSEGTNDECLVLPQNCDGSLVLDDDNSDGSLVLDDDNSDGSLVLDDENSDGSLVLDDENCDGSLVPDDENNDGTLVLDDGNCDGSLVFDDDNCDGSLVLDDENCDESLVLDDENCDGSLVLDDDNKCSHKYKGSNKIINIDDDNNSPDEIGDDSSDSDNLTSVLQKANNRRPSWLFEDI